MSSVARRNHQIRHTELTIRSRKAKYLGLDAAIWRCLAICLLDDTVVVRVGVRQDVGRVKWRMEFGVGVCGRDEGRGGQRRAES